MTSSPRAGDGETRIVDAKYYNGPVYYDGAWNNGFLSDTDEFEEWWETMHEGEPMPETVQACTVTPLRVPSACDLMDRIAEDSYDGAYEDLTGDKAAMAKLQVAIDEFNAHQFAREYNPDPRTRVRLSVASSSPASGGR